MRMTKEKIREAGLYILVSLTATAIELFLFDLISGPLEPYFPLMYITIATLMARVVSDLYKYLLDRRIFGAENEVRKGLVRYIILALGKVIMSALLVTVLAMLLKYDETLIKMVVDVTIFIPAFFIEKMWVHN